MKRIIFILMLMCSPAFTGEEEEIAELKLRVARLEQLVYVLLQRNDIHSQETQVINPPIPEVRKQYIVTLYDDSTFLIHKWDRRSITKRHQDTGRILIVKQYIMIDTFGKTRTWSCDKVKSITLVE